MAREVTAPQWEPSAEALADEVRALNATLGVTYIQQAVPNVEALRRIADRNLRRQHEREAFVIERIKRAQDQIRDKYHPSWAEQTLEQALLHLAKLDAKSERTLLEAAKEIVAPVAMGNAEEWIAVPKGDWNALKAAVEREERGK